MGGWERLDGWMGKAGWVDGKSGMGGWEPGGGRNGRMAPDDELERNKNLNRGFRKLHVWQEAIGLSVCVKKIAASTKIALKTS